MADQRAKTNQILLTGATGFVGKVVLEELLRRKEELNVGGIHLIIRPDRRRDGTVRSPKERFFNGIAKAELFKAHAPGWESMVHVVKGEIAQPNCGIDDGELETLLGTITHVVHCAASIEFDLPVAEAAEANITAALNVLELAKRAPNLVQMVDVSTCYVTPWRPGPIGEELAHLPRPAEDLYANILSGHADEDALKKETGHPNTYALTKCIGEHLLTARREHVPLTIVRPSVVAATWQRPFPGWIDSAAAFGGCMLYIGLGVIRAFNGDPKVRLDVVPVDEVSTRVVEAALVAAPPAPAEGVRIIAACAGLENSSRLDLSAHATQTYFAARPGTVAVPSVFLGSYEHGFKNADIVRRAIPTMAKRAVLAATFNRKDLSRLNKADEKIRYMNECFAYFTRNTFDFRSSKPFIADDFSPQKYTMQVAAGLYRHICRKDERELTLAGEAHEDARNDVQWVTEKPNANWAVRMLGFGFRKVLRKSTTQVTWDRASFEDAMRSVPPGTTIVLAPSHRSYFDFLLASYLCFQHPELGIPVPHIAAAEEFSHIPLVGPLLEQSQAFFIKRGVGQEVPEVTEQMAKLAEKGASLMFFVEGQRSRSRQSLPPRRGLLRALQNSGHTCMVLPISFSYDRVPEESAFEKELKGAPKPGMSLSAVLGWLKELSQGDVQLGRAHVACGTPLKLDAKTDVKSMAERLVAEQQRMTAVTTFHLRAFLAHTRLPDVTEAWLADAIRARGGRVLESDLDGAELLPPATRLSLQNQWMHWFFGDAMALAGHHPAVEDHVVRYQWMESPTGGDRNDVRLRSLVAALFEPIQADYALAARTRYPTAGSLMHDYPSAQVSNIEDAFEAMVLRGFLKRGAEPRTYAPGPNLDGLPDYLKQVSQPIRLAIAGGSEFRAPRASAPTFVSNAS